MQEPKRGLWALEDWETPPALPSRSLPGGLRVCPYVGVRIPQRIHSERYFEKYLRHAWYMQDPKIWDMLPFVRDQWFDKILDSWKVYNRRIRFDMTHRFKVQVRKLIAKGGLVAVIGGRPAAQGDGKSIGALMFIDLLREEFGVDVTAHILWEHSHMQLAIDEEDTSGFLILDIDEDLTATGEGSKTILIEISNTWQTNRKPKLIIISVGIDPGASHPAVNIHLIPAGIWVEYQATRFGMFAGGRFVGWAVLQRQYRPDWLVKYGLESELAPVDEYDARATAHSRNVLRIGVSAFPAHVEATHIDTVLEWLKMDEIEAKALELDWKPPAVDVMITEVKQMGLPTKNISYPRRICATALRRFLRKNPEYQKKRTEKVVLGDMKEVSEFWKDYQTVVYSNFPSGYKLSDRDAWMITFAHMGKTHPWIKEKLGLTILVNSIGERIRRGVSEWKVKPSKTQLGTLGERFIGSRIESSGVRGAVVYAREGSAKKGVPDVSDTGIVRSATWSVNVKVSMEDDFDRVFETTPEHKVKRSWCVFLFPRLAKMAVCDIEGENTRYNFRAMVLCGIAEGVALLKEKIDGD